MALSDIKVSWGEGGNKRTGAGMNEKYAEVMNTKRCKGREKDRNGPTSERDVKGCKRHMSEVEW